MKRFGSIYLITFTQTGEQYVGQTCNSVPGRFNDHCRDRRSSRHLSSAIQKHGRENFTVKEIFVAFDEDSLNYYETYFIKFYNTLSPNGYNLSMGGHNRGIISELTRESMRNAKLGKKVNRTREWSEMSRLNKSLTQNGKSVVAINLKTNEVKKYDYIQLACRDGFYNGDIYRVLKGERKSCKGHLFLYEEDYANQSGSLESKVS
jgi:group I intron endonuclease